MAAAGVVSWAGAQDWVRVPRPDLPAALVSSTGPDGEMALALTLGLVLLACWGVLLVTRRVVRRLVAGLALLTSLGLCGVVVSAWLRTPPVTGWFWAGAAASAVAVATTALAVAWCPQWPEMGARYDAPGSEPAPPSEDQSSLDLWKSLDEGRDPTA